MLNKSLGGCSAETSQDSVDRIFRGIHFATVDMKPCNNFCFFSEVEGRYDQVNS